MKTAVAGVAVLGLLGVSSAVAATPHGSRLGGSHPAKSKAATLGTPKIAHVPGAYSLTAISCVSIKYCVAVGNASGPKNVGGVVVPIVKGKAQKVITTDDPTSVMFGVGCLSKSECVVAGGSKPDPTKVEKGAIWLLRGRKLIGLGGERERGDEPSEYRGVSCVARLGCTVVGAGVYSTNKLKNISTGQVGSVEFGSPPTFKVKNDPAKSESLDAVDCPDADDCFAGGTTQMTNIAVLVGYPGHGHVNSRTEPKASVVRGVACQSQAVCELAEVKFLPNFTYAGYVQRAKGPDTTAPKLITGSGQVIGIARVGKPGYLVVGYVSGTQWLVDLVSAKGRPAPAVGLGLPGLLQGVACPSSSKCLAVGNTTDTNPNQPGGYNGYDGAIATFKITG